MEKVSSSRMKQLVDEVYLEALAEVKAINIPVSDKITGISINTRTTKRLGRCYYNGNTYRLEISAYIFLCDDYMGLLKNTMVHEILHTCKNSLNHGDTWKRYARMMNNAYGYSISRETNLNKYGISKEAVLSKSKYIIRCKKCQSLSYRTKATKVTQHINNYKCKCGGKLELLETA